MKTRRSPRVSFIIAAYNHERFIAQAIESVLAQTYPAESLEVIVIDDGSTDATPERVKPYLDRVTYIRKPNEGAGSNFNPAVERATGEFITFLDGDDAAPPDKVRCLVDVLLERPDVGLAYGEMAIIDEHDNLITPSYRLSLSLPAYRGRVLGELMHRNFVAGGSMLFRSAYKKQLLPMPKWLAYGDWWVALRIAAEAKIEYVPQVVNYYRKHANNFALVEDQSKRANLRRRDAELQRWLLTQADPTKLTIRETLDAYVAFENSVQDASSLGSLSVGDVVHVTDQDQRQALELVEAGVREFKRDDVHAALNLWVKALAADPWSVEARKIVGNFIPSLSPLFAARPAPEEPMRLDGRRGTAFLLHPNWHNDNWQEALVGYTRTFARQDDVTLVVYLDPTDQVSSAERADALGQALESAGVDEAELPDILLVAERLDSAGLRRLHAAVDVVIGSEANAWSDAFKTLNTAA
jgi:GT2 family glycosyltransferase